MPTAAKLVAALLFAALGWVVSDLVKPLLDEGAKAGLFSPVSAVFGFLVGWFFVGLRIGSGHGGHFGVGVAGSGLLVFWVTLGFSGYEMYNRSLRMTYDGPVEALQSMFEIAGEYLWMAAVPGVILALILGGMFGGWLTKRASERWP